MIYLVLSDYSTYDADGFVAVLTERGKEELSEALDFQGVSEDEIVEVIPVSHLLDAWNQLNGTYY